MSRENTQRTGNVGRLTIRGLVVRALPDSDLSKRVEVLETALEALVLELVEVGSLPPDPPTETP